MKDKENMSAIQKFFDIHANYANEYESRGLIDL